MESTWLLAFLLVLAAIGFAVGSVLLVRRRLPVERLQRQNEVTGPIHATVGVLYAVILAFVVIVVWEEFNLADEAVAREAGELIALNHDIATLEGSAATRMHEALHTYALSVIDIEWKALRANDPLPHTTAEYTHLWRALRSVKADDRTDRVWLASMIDRLNEVDRWRNRRILAVETRVPTAMWVLLIAGGLITVAFAAFFGAEHGPTQIVMVATLAALIAFILFLVAAIDHPFNGAVCVGPDAFDHALLQIEEAGGSYQQLTTEP